MTQNHGSVLSCNEIYTFSEGIVFHADGWHTKIWDNTVTRADTGMRFINDGIVGQQGSGVSAIAAKNNWYQFHPDSTSQVMVTATHTDGTQNKNFVSNDTVSNPEDAVYDDVTLNSTKNLAPGQPLFLTPFSTVVDLSGSECSESVADLDHSGTGGATKLFELLVRDSVPFGYWTTQMPHYRDIFAWDFLMNDSLIRESDTLYTDFLNALQETNIGNIAGVWKALSEGDMGSATSLNNYNPDNELEENLNEAFQSVIQVLTNGPDIISESDSAWLDSLAGKCAVEYGSGVYVARAIMGLINPDKEYEDPCLPTGSGSGKRAMEKQLKSSSGNQFYITAYPNPAESDFWVMGNSMGGTLEISGMDGRFLKIAEVAAGDFKVKVSKNNLSKGVYIIRLWNEAQAPLYIKIVLI